MSKTSILNVLFILSSLFSSAQTKVKFYTTLGDFEVLLYDSVVPITAGNFIDLVNQKYYDGIIFHRVIDDFMIQGGDPTGTGAGGPGYTIDDEFDSTLSNVQKTISMANSGPNTGGSQFFINLVDNTYLDYNKAPFTSKHPVFGIVTDSFEVVQRIGATPTNIQNRPRTPVIMDSIRPLPKPSILRTFHQLTIVPTILNENAYLILSDAPEHAHASPIELRCVSARGEVVWQQQEYSLGGTTICSLKSLYQVALAPGIYTLQLMDGEEVFSARFTIL